MGQLANRLIVADTGPLLALARLNLLAIPRGLFSQVLLTSMILSECEARPDRGEGTAIRAALDAGHLQLRDPGAPLPVLGIDPGETSAIQLALEQSAALLLDDKAGRAVAKQLGIAIIGTAGLLVLAKRKRQVVAVRPLLEALIESGYFLGPDVMRDVLRLSNE